MGPKLPRFSTQTFVVLDALVASPELSGAQIARITGLASGTLYPLLLRLERAGCVESRWEADDPHALGRPRRRFYQVTPLGEKNARTEAQRLEPTIRRLAWGDG
jgi:PadR family transcriptional regulator, regulatory protein PadR